jgi:hypothetical protein
MAEKKEQEKKPSYTDKELNAGDLTFHYWGAMEYLVGLIKSSELKAGLILSFYGIIFNFVYQNVENIKETLSEYSFLYLLLLIWLVLTLKSMFHSVSTFIPRIEKEYDSNVFFFGDIISKYGDINQFSKTFLKTTVDKEEVYDQIGQQIYINAKITALKFKNVNKSIRYLVYSLVVLLLLVLSEIGIMLFLK